MKVTIFGATGRTGQQLITQALAAGHEVVAYVRNPGKVTQTHPRLQIVVGSLEDDGALGQALHGADAVLSGLGPVGNQPDYVLGRSAPHLIGAMQAEGVSRLVLATGAGVRRPGDAPGLFDCLMGFLLNTLAKHVLEDSRRMVTAVVNSDLAWTIVRVPVLNDNPATGKVRVGMVGKGTGSKLSRADMAAFMRAQLQSDQYVRQAPTISN
jgi:putative NADH-flavin reductase